MFNGLLLTADWHLRPDTPICRTDDFLVAQWGKLEQVQKYARENELAWIDAGDIFHKAIPSLHFVNQVLTRLHEPIEAGVMGNHDMPAHNMGRVMESAWGTLRESCCVIHMVEDNPIHINIASNCVAEIYGASYGQDIPEPYEKQHGVFKVLLMHDMVYASKKDAIPNAPGSLAKKLLRDNKEYDLIVTGHNHQSFMVELNGRHLINIGSMTRQTADQANHIPKFAVWQPGSGLEWIVLAHDTDVVSREHIEKKEQKEEELNAFVQSLQDVEEVSLSFEDNVETVIQKTKPEKPVENKVREAMNGRTS